MKKINPICLICKTEMTWIQNNVCLYHTDEGLGDDAKIDWLVIGDQYKCKKCAAMIVTHIENKFRAMDHSQKELLAIKNRSGERIRI